MPFPFWLAEISSDEELGESDAEEGDESDGAISSITLESNNGVEPPKKKRQKWRYESCQHTSNLSIKSYNIPLNQYCVQMR